MIDNTTLKTHSNTDQGTLVVKIQRWGGLASFIMVVALVAAHMIYLSGDLRDAWGSLSYTLADLLYGPVFGASLVMVVYALRERVGDRAPRLMTLALLMALAAACAFVAVASIRSTNRTYHVTHPELNLQSSTMVLTMWATLVAGVIGAAWHFLGWAFVLIGSAGWTSRRLPRILSGLYLFAGAVSLSVFIAPGMEGNAIVLTLVISVWQAILLWTSAPGVTSSPGKNASPPAQA